MTTSLDTTYHVAGVQRDDHPQYARTDGTRAHTGALTAPAYAATLSASGRYVGSTNGSPTGRPYLAGDFANDPTNRTFWVCTVGGSPGTWVAVPGVTDSGWTNFGPLSNAWTVAPGFQPAYFRINGVVYLRGTVTGGVLGTSCQTLPVGYRPSATFSPATNCNSSGAVAQLNINTDGTVVPAAGSATNFNLYCSFPVAA